MDDVSLQLGSIHQCSFSHPKTPGFSIHSKSARRVTRLISLVYDNDNGVRTFALTWKLAARCHSERLTFTWIYDEQGAWDVSSVLFSRHGSTPPNNVFAGRELGQALRALMQ
jgi:hypothetical protein